jgi:hypothetical protein
MPMFYRQTASNSTVEMFHNWMDNIIIYHVKGAQVYHKLLRVYACKLLLLLWQRFQCDRGNNGAVGLHALSLVVLLFDIY